MPAPRPALALFLSITLILGFGAYSAFQARHLAIGPRIVLAEELHGMHATTSFLSLSGRAQNSVRTTINGRDIFIDENEHFEEELLLGDGYTIITLTAEDRFGRKTTKTLELTR